MIAFGFERIGGGELYRLSDPGVDEQLVKFVARGRLRSDTFGPQIVQKLN
jgi:hypothetical protein